MVICNAQVNEEPVYDEVREESGQVISSNQVTMGPDPACQAYQDLLPLHYERVTKFMSICNYVCKYILCVQTNICICV